MDALENRLSRLEQTNRFLLSGLFGCIALAIVGFQSVQQPGVLKAKDIELVDDRGIPLITLEATRGGGASIVLRDESGDRRMWMTSEGGSSRIGMISGQEDSPSSTLGLSVDSNQSRLSLTGNKATAVVVVEGAKPTVELTGNRGQSLFTAPFNRNSANSGF